MNIDSILDQCSITHLLGNPYSKMLMQYATRRILPQSCSDWRINSKIYMEESTEQKKDSCLKTLGSDHQRTYSFQWLEQKPQRPQTPRPLNHPPFSPLYSSHLQDQKASCFLPSLLPPPNNIFTLLGKYYSSLKTFNLSWKHQIHSERPDILKFFLYKVYFRNWNVL